MFEHLDDHLPPVGLLADPSFAEVQERTRRARRRQNIVVTTLSLSLLATGGVSGLALDGPDSVHAPIGAGPLLALGDPRSTATDLPPALLTGSDRTNPSICPTTTGSADPGGFAAAAVADPAPATPGLRSAADDATGAPVSAWGGAVASIAAGATGSPTAPGGGWGGAPSSGAGSTPRPVVGPRPTLPGPVPMPPPVTSGGGGSQVPVDPTTPPVVVPPPVISDPGTGSGGPTTGPTDPPTVDPTGDPGSGDPGAGDPGAGDPGAGDPGAGDPGAGDPGAGDPGAGGTGAGGTGDGTPTPDPTDASALADQFFG